MFSFCSKRERDTHRERELPIQFDTEHKKHTQIKPQNWKKSVMAIKTENEKKTRTVKTMLITCEIFFAA